jgi:Zn-dependent protease with chaperone function
VLTLIFTVNSRRNEFAADNFAKELGMSSGLQSGLIKIHTGTVVVSWMCVMLLSRNLLDVNRKFGQLGARPTLFSVPLLSSVVSGEIASSQER